MVKVPQNKNPGAKNYHKITAHIFDHIHIENRIGMAESTLQIKNPGVLMITFISSDNKI